ncbi:protease inhibitor I42 family protein [Pseudomonas sp. NCCP-436]|uniref:protease inhibitor I42 family protein n=1 Tax=Pseudomonas sp. NCCP-436 TaxID=2842481 RepID=UPI001C813696|nr:protease inhibitor I42 family protein [Pseudomonas sp. NCCP-436]GIZ11532.1 peptidase inhibitor [Pseudomonas sp. NCCP-436]
MNPPLRLLALPTLALLGACAHQPGSLELTRERQCPLTLNVGQQLILSLPSNPSTGFRWNLRDAAEPALQSLGPEVYSAPENSGLIGAGGISTWRFSAREPGEGRLLLTYQQPWEPDVEPAETFTCELRVK